MPNTPITMNKLRIIIRLYSQGMGPRTICPLARTSRNTVKKYIKTWNSLGLSYAEFQRKSDHELSVLFCEGASKVPLIPWMEDLERRLPGVCKELSKKGMTTLKLWEKYIEEYPQGYGLTQFRLAIQRHRKITNPVLHMDHKAGDKLFIDYTGDKLHIYPPNAEPRPVEVFVAILGCSMLTYVEAVESQRREDLITACENAFYYYGGVPQAIVPDNLKSAVTKASRYEAVLNEELTLFSSFAPRPFKQA